jgi:Domain of unknown function (DUF1905)/Bacteriocin-protection, YdeI or OmpD-Associated
MITLQVKLQKFKEQGEKTGWTYIEIPSKIANQLSPCNKKSFRVKGTMDDYSFRQIALIPMGDGDFIIPFNAVMRKHTGKKVGDTLALVLSFDAEEKRNSEDLLNCLAEDPICLERFLALPKGHQNYYSNWVDSAKSPTTKSDRIVKTIFAMQHQMDYGAMIRHFKSLKR